MMRTGGRLLHEWPLLMSLLWRPSPSDRSTLAAKLLKASLPQNMNLSQNQDYSLDLRNQVCDNNLSYLYVKAGLLENIFKSYKVIRLLLNQLYKKVFLTVSGQVHLEAICNGKEKVYTFGPVFRAEMGRTRRYRGLFH